MIKKIVALGIISTLSTAAISANIEFSCSGKMGGQRILEEQFVFDIAVDDKTGNMIAPGSPSGCYALTGQKFKAECSINQASASCKCESFWGISYLTLSRSTAILTIDKIWKDGDISKGIFTCSRITKKVF